MTTIDISEESLARESTGLLRTLLKDRTTNKFIVWATHSYELLGKGFGLYDRITPSKVTGPYANLIQPRSEKSKYEQKDRTKVRAEVFTPTWLVKKQSDAVDQDFQDLDLEAYLNLKWLEITCGEAPYMVSRYDTVTGQALDLEERVGFLDRKLHRLSQQVHEEESWFQGAVTAYQNAYGYEYQGDSLLLARENLLASFIDYYQAKFAQEPSPSQKQTIAQIISYNVLQMDGLTYTSPYSEQAKEAVQLSLFEEIAEQTSQPQKAQIKDWKTNKLIDFERLSQGESPMKFDVVIGNPPYQDTALGENATFAPPIYHNFIDESQKISDKSILVTPGRFLFNAGSTPKAWNRKMLSDPHVKVVYYEQNSSMVFPGTDIKGGVAITYQDKTKDFGAIETFTPYAQLNSILKKVSPLTEQTFDTIVSGRGVYKLSQKALDDFPEIEQIQSKGHKKDIGSGAFRILKDIVFYENVPNDGKEYVKFLGLENLKRTYYWIASEYVDAPLSFSNYKIFIPKSNGSGALGEVPSTPLIGAPLIGATETFLSLGNFSTQLEAENCLKYIKTKFARAMLGVLKITQDNTRDKWAKVPLQDFTSISDIDWSQSVAEIDAQLYKKYGLSQEEIDFIESKVREMD
ncbi:Eco57I restriction-modification methylase domain-containing protein [Streptococcus suis]|uniref:Eco57I restriction-modification methylase domain-containing protein n=1 Tax=Streptococcus suis TaxID=1307 RepID=UPI0003FD7D13|nr:Eco57I restriction-modification methylase domain-containing protein [Streptococcus suis]MBY4961236.1 Eco57I restriction-modification methylase domain-containing protein [Streptococcus suis]MBY4967559.1 Eco57I restriction-modification methylase domain-containing protein [Streptococcus suis]MBY4978633.1 Eco57I restriction-modification methylase domain-containing protein [Streptococcus suis]MBY4987142.1 Eco57I restriction-modification methylase domain-containing protein [Streptococcus suis]MBY